MNFLYIFSGSDCHITQIAVGEVEGNRSWQSYVLPKIDIEEEASNITKITYSGGVLKVNGQEVAALRITEALDQMMKWIQETAGERKVLLAAHNCRRFDSKVIISALRNTKKFEDFSKSVVGFIDTLNIFRKVVDKSCSLKQNDLYERAFPSHEYNAHDALSDIKALIELLHHHKIKFTDYIKSSFAVKSVHFQQDFDKERKRLTPTLHPLIAAGVKSTTAENIAGSGLGMAHLQHIYSRGKEDGLRNVLSAKNSEGGPRVLKQGKLLDQLVAKLVDYFEKLSQ